MTLTKAAIWYFGKWIWKRDTVSKTKEGAYYCHAEGYSYIPMFGSIGDKKKAQEVCRLVNYPWSKDRWACNYPVVR